jgi:hypothetical protein
MPYHLQGSLLEVCTCRVLCPCWIGEDPDHDTCDSVNSWHIDQGTIDGIDVSGLTVATLNHIPGNVLKCNWGGRPLSRALSAADSESSMG